MIVLVVVGEVIGVVDDITSSGGGIVGMGM